MFNTWRVSVAVPRNRVFPGIEIKTFDVTLEAEDIMLNTVGIIIKGKGWDKAIPLGVIKVKTTRKREEVADTLLNIQDLEKE